MTSEGAPEGAAPHGRARGLRALLALCLLAPFWRLVSLRGVIVPDDIGTSDLMNGEFPARVALGRMLRAGDAPVWLADIHGGMPLVAVTDPASAALFALLPPVAALNALLLGVLLTAAFGALALGRRLGMSPSGALVTGLSFALSGYMVCQLRHLGVVTTVCWLPLGLLALDHALDPAPGPDARRRRARAMAGFAAVFSAQLSAGFPQSGYISGLLYAGFALTRAASLSRGGKGWGAWREGLTGLGLFPIACALAALVAMVQLLPLWELGRLSVRSEGVSLSFASQYAYNARAWVTFFVPYALGDAGENTYAGGVFWEDYGYVGTLTPLLALYALWARRSDPTVRFFAAACALSYLVVLGPHTPVFRALFHVLPGMSLFRLPTRFLVLTDLSLCVLGGIGLTALEAALRDRPSSLFPTQFLGPAVFALTVGNLLWTQTRQNPIADAHAWMTPPATARAILREGGGRVYTLDPYSTHQLAFAAARGWQDLSPYLVQREFLQPSANILWGVTSADGYAGISTRHVVALWGNHDTRKGIVRRLVEHQSGRAEVDPRFFRLLAMNNVRFLISPAPVASPELQPVPVNTPAALWLYRLPHALPRAWIVPQALRFARDREAAQAMLHPAFDPRRQVVLQDAPGPDDPPPSDDLPWSEARAVIRSRHTRELQVDTASPAPAWLVLSESDYPGWTARIDGRPTPVVRANINHRAVRVPAGRHAVRFTFDAAAHRRGLYASLAGLSLLASWFLVTSRGVRSRRGSG